MFWIAFMEYFGWIFASIAFAICLFLLIFVVAFLVTLPGEIRRWLKKQKKN